MARAITAFLALLTVTFATPAGAKPAPAPIEVRVVVVATWEYEPGGKSVMGELKYWRERWPLPEVLPFPAGNHTLHYDPKSHVMAIVTGMQTARASASIMALGLDPRFDLTHAYWLVAGTAGTDPKTASIGSAAWSRWVIDGDLGQEIDAREIPADWPTGIFPSGRTAPYQLPAPPGLSFAGNTAFPLNTALVRWAYDMSRNTKLLDDEKLAAARKPYSGQGAKPPFVLEGEGLMSARFRYGARVTEWSQRWVDYWTGGKGVFAMAAEEDAGIMQGLTMLAGAGKVKLDRVLVLRAASDYTVGPPGISAVELMLSEAKTGPVGTHQALENLYRTASPVVRYLTDNWAETRDKVPGK